MFGRETLVNIRMQMKQEAKKERVSFEFVAPWVCHICRQAFELDSGGICSQCKQPACSGHLVKTSAQLELAEETWICIDCKPTQVSDVSLKRKMQLKSVEELEAQGYAYDPQGLTEFLGRYSTVQRIAWCAVLLGFVLATIGGIWFGPQFAHKEFLFKVGFFFLFVSFCVIGLTDHFLFKSCPRSRHTGKPMLQYESTSRPSNHDVIYVCPDSKTFFVKHYGKTDD